MTGRAYEIYMNSKELLQSKISCWLAAREPQRVLCAEPTLKAFVERNSRLPEAVSYQLQELRGTRIKMRRFVRNAAAEPVSASWPKDRLIASRAALLICPLEGAANVRIGNYLLHLPEGQPCLLPPEIPRTDGSESHITSDHKPPAHCALWWLKGNVHGLESWICVSQNAEHFCAYKSRFIVTHPQAKVLFHMLVHELQHSTQPAFGIQYNLLNVIYGLVLRELHSEQPLPLAPSSQGALLSTGHWDPIQLACNLVNENLNRPLHVDEVARLVYMSPSKFSERFHRETGETFNRYYNKRRLERATTYLRDTDWSIAAIAKNCGMNVSHLRRLCHEYYSVSPQQYRSHAQKNQ